MPLIRIENYPQTTPGYCNVRDLAKALQSACITTEVPGINSAGQVTVVAGGSQLLEDDRTLVVIVEGLFDRPDRTKVIRDRLANRLAKHAKINLPPDWKVEILVKRFNPEKDSYVEIGAT